MGKLTHVIGILGGTFDPPHIAHLAMAHAAREQLGLDEVLFMPAGDPWQKSRDTITPSVHRMAMARLAASAAPYFRADDREIRRAGPTYTIDTVAAMEERCLLIVGADAAMGIGSWHRSGDLIGSASFGVVDRPGVRREDVDVVLSGTMRWIDMPMIDISSTDIRSYVANGHTARFLVPEAVERYIESNGLYR